MTTLMNQEAKKWLADVPEEYIFWCCDGRTMRNMQELAEALNTMMDEVFSYHASQERNDFSTWVGDIIRDDDLAADLRQAFSRSAAAVIVTQRVTALSDSLKPAKKTPRKKPYSGASRKKKV
jgi:hypothetical protein